MKLAKTLGSIKLAVVLLGAIGVACVIGTLLPQKHANRLVYGSFWFLGLLTLLGVNLVVCTVSRYRVWTRRYGFVVTHLSILFIIAGALVDGIWGERGMMVLDIGKEGNTFGPPEEVRTLPFTVRLGNFTVERHPSSLALAITDGHKHGSKPFEIDAGREYPISHGHVLRVEEVGRNLRRNTHLIAGDGEGALALRVAYRTDGGEVTDAFLVERKSGQFSTRNKALRVVLQVFKDAETRDRELAAAGATGNGYIQIGSAADGQQRLPVTAGASVELGGGAAVRVLQYLPHFVITDGEARSVSDNPVNPAVQLAVEGPGDERHTMWVFARFPDYSTMHGKADGPSFKFVRPKDAGCRTNVFLYAVRDAGIRYAVAGPGGRPSVGDVEVGSAIPLGPEGHYVKVTERLPSGVLKEEVLTVDAHSGHSHAGAKVQVLKDGSPVGPSSWLIENEPLRQIAKGYAARLGSFQGKIKDFKSVLEVLVDGQVVKQSVVEVNHPLLYGGYALYQSSYDKDHERWSGIEVVKAPGVPFIYIGFSLFLIGLILALYVQPYLRQSRRAKEEADLSP